MKERRVALSGVATVAFFAAITTSTVSVAQDKGQGTDNPCWVQLYDGKNFTDENDRIHGPGKWNALRNLPGAKKTDWGDEADSLKVGPGATVQVWNNENFNGKSATYGPGTERPNLPEEPESMAITCK